MKPKAILFDVDGTILDTHEYIYQAFDYSLRTYHSAVSRDKLSRIMGKPLLECYQILTSLENVEHFVQAHKQFQLENIHLAIPFPHTISTLEKLKEKGLLLAAVTNRAKKSVKETLEMTEIIHYLNYYIGVEDVTLPKPNPEGIHKVLTFLEIDPKDAVMVGDSDVDVMAGRSAGLKTIGVTYGFHREAIKEARPDYVIEDIKDLLTVITN